MLNGRGNGHKRKEQNMTNGRGDGTTRKHAMAIADTKPLFLIQFRKLCISNTFKKSSVKH